MPFEPTGGRANAVLERKNSANADIAVEMIAIRLRRFILPSFRHGSSGLTQVNMARFLSTLLYSHWHLAGQLLCSRIAGEVVLGPF